MANYLMTYFCLCGKTENYTYGAKHKDITEVSSGVNFFLTSPNCTTPFHCIIIVIIIVITITINIVT